MFFLFVGFSSSINLFAQTIASLETLSRKTLIEEALTLVSPPIDTSYFARIKVMASADEIFVSFENPIIYVPQQKEYYYEVLVNITNEMVSYESRSNPENYSSTDPLGYFTPTEEQEREMCLALNAIHKTKASLKEYLQRLNGTRYLILPAQQHINVWMISDYQEVEYRIDRETLEITEMMKAQLEPDFFFDSNFVEIKR